MCPSCGTASALQPSEGEVCSWPTGALSSFLLVLALQSSVPQQGGDRPAAPPGTPCATTLCHPAWSSSTQSQPSPASWCHGPRGGRQGWQLQWQQCQPAVPPRHGSALAQRIHHLLKQSTHSAAPFVINYANQHTITLR